jgi:hypothetical protein
MQTITLQGYHNTLKVIEALKKLEGEKASFLTHAELVHSIRKKMGIKVDSALLRHLIKSSKLKISPLRYDVPEATSPMRIKMLLVSFFDHRIETNGAYQTMYKDCVPVFPDHIRAKGTNGEFLYQDARQEVNGLFAYYLHNQRQEQLEIPFEEEKVESPEPVEESVVRVVMNPENIMISMGAVTVMYSGEILYTDNR